MTSKLLDLGDLVDRLLENDTRPNSKISLPENQLLNLLDDVEDIFRVR